MATYEERLNEDPALALREGGAYFAREGAVHETLGRLSERLRSLGIPHALVGGMALFLHGYRRFTEDVDVLVTEEGLKAIQAALVGKGYRPLFPGSRGLRDAETGVRVEFLVAGEYPGDGKPKPVSFPDPADVVVEVAGVDCIRLPRLVELKLASGTAPGRRRDLADVQELIRALRLPRELGDDLAQSVRHSYLELWDELQREPPHP
jgi:hypothetical protein